MDDEERLEGEEEMELDEPSDGEDDDEENSGIPISPANSDQLLGSTPTPSTSQCLNFHADSLNSNARDAYSITPEEVFHDPMRYQKFPLPGGKPLHIRRGPGRPRKERPPGAPRGSGIRRGFGRGSARGKGFGYGRGMPRRTKSKDDDTHSESPSPLRIGDDGASIDGESSGLDRAMPAPEEPPYFPEQWPGKVCALCNLSERSQLGQGELLKLPIPEDFTPEKCTNREETAESLIDVHVAGDKSPRASNSLGAVTCRRQKSLAKCRNPSLTNFTEPVEELTIVGYLDEPDLGSIFELGHYYVHQACALWTSANQDMPSEIISSTIVQASTRRCAFCSHYGAGISCKVQSCNRYFHYPCAAASSCFQDIKSLSLFCSQHLGQVPLLLNSDGERIKCMMCHAMGDVSKLVMCSMCGQHYHGNCQGLSLLPSVRAGWQCTNCRVCQVCRQPEELAKVMTCERCDKAYHPSCLRPIVTSIPKYGWKCKCCRVCTDCGSRTPGAGLSSRWHSHYTVCDSCYQQRNKGFSCPLCRKAYRAAAYREMVQCSSCKKFVHGTCDPEADPLTYQHRKEVKADYEYVCLHCKNVALVKRKDSIEDYGGESSLTASQESLFGDGDSSELDYQGNSEDAFYSIGLGKGKPFCASKIAKKRLGLGGGLIGRPKGVGKLGYQKRQKITEFGRKRGPKAKMRGIFGVPGVGLQRPLPDSYSKEEEPGVENRLVLCSAKDKFVLSQDICVMCGAIGTDQEGCLIACAQCGQCYHPYCANVKVTKVILQKGWRCLDCTVCEGCGERNDEGRLILCDDCDISYHIYCMDPPLEYVPQGTWKCKWCAHCQTCGSNDPGFNSSWQRNYTQCGPCASHAACAACTEAYSEGDLIIQCVQCERWLHCMCDNIKTDSEAEKCAEEGYHCVLCRPRDVPPPHILCSVPKAQPAKYQQPRTPPPIVRSPELEKPTPQSFLVEGIVLSEAGMSHIKSLMSEHQITKKKRRKLAQVLDKDADIMATIESVVAGGSLDNSLEENAKLELIDVKDEPTQVYKEGMVWTPRGDQPPPEGFSIYTTESGICVLKRKRQRNLQKLGIGGFVVRLRGTRKDKEDEPEVPGLSEGLLSLAPDDKPRRKPQRRKPKTKLAECFPLYMQEAFFGRDLMETTKEKDLDSSSDSENERNNSANADTIQLSRDELQAMEQVKAKQEKDDEPASTAPTVAPAQAQPSTSTTRETQIKREEIVKEEGSDTEALEDILPISGDLFDRELINTIMNEPDEDLAKATEAWEELEQAPEPTKDELPDILSPHFNLESMVRDTGLTNIASQDVEEIFKGVLTDESQESRESCGFSAQTQTPQVSSSSTPLVSPSPHPVNIQPANLPIARPQVPTNLPSVGHSNLNSPMSFPPPSPYHSEYSNSPFSPAFSEPPSPWVNAEDEGSTPTSGTAAITYNQRTSIKMEADEALGKGATTASVLYANMNHPEWKTEYPIWSERYKQIVKKWRALPSDKKAPYVSQARENRAAIRMKKAQQIPKELASPGAPIPSAVSSGSVVPAKGATGQVVPPVVVMATSQKPDAGGKEQKPTTDSNASGAGNPAAAAQVAAAAQAAAAQAASAAPTTQLAEEQDKLANRDRSTREAEQERQWKQLQAMRQQQAQIQQQVIHDQRAHAIARVHRQLSEDGTPTLSHENTGAPQMVTVPQDGNTMGQLGPGQQQLSNQPRTQFAAPVMKVNRAIVPPNSNPGMAGRLVGQQSQQQQPPQAQPQPPQQQQQVVSQQGQVTQVGRPMTGVVARPGMPPGGFVGQQQPPSPFSPQAPQSPHDFPQSPASQTQPQPEHFQRFESADGFGQASQTQTRPTPSYSTSPRGDVFPQPPGTPRPIFSTPRPTSHVYAPPRTPEAYPPQQQPPPPQQPQQLVQSQVQQQLQGQPPPPPSPAAASPVQSYMSPRSDQRPDSQPNELFGQQPEVNRQLRDLLQRQQQFNKDMKPMNQAWAQDGQTPGDVSPQQFDGSHVQLQQHPQQSPNPADGTFRQPLPPGAARPRMPSVPNVLIRGPMGLTPRHPGVTNIDAARLQGIDPRTRMLLQRPPVPVSVAQQFQNNQIMQQRMAGPRSQITEQYDVLQRFPDASQAQALGQRIVRTAHKPMNPGIRMISTVGMVRPPILPTVSEANVTMSETSEIPDNVTAELEKLEQEGAPMVEVENVSAILGDLADDDDELLAEMGADFNILEYADPDLDQLTGGKKANILDLELEQDEVEMKDEKKKDVKDEEHKSKSIGNVGVADTVESGVSNSMQTSTDTSNVLTQVQTVGPMGQNLQGQSQAMLLSPPHPPASVQQQMNNQLQHAAALGRPMAPGTRLLSPDGAIGIVTSSNSVTISYPPTFPQHPQQSQQSVQPRIPQHHLQQVRQQQPQLQQQQHMGMRPTGVPNVAGRVVPVGHMIGQRMPLAPPPPPPPPYPGPPPPYPGPMQMGLCPSDRGMPRPPIHMGHSVPVVGPPLNPMVHTGATPMTPHPHRRPLLLQEQPLLLEELLEQEKREQEKQQQQQQQQQQQADTTTPAGSLLSEIEFERLRADVLGSSPLSSPPQGIITVPPGVGQIRPAAPPRPPLVAAQNWQQPVASEPGKVVVQAQRQPQPPVTTQTSTEPRIATFNIPHLPAPPVPPDNIVTDQDRQTQLQYEQWLNHQHQILTQQLKYYETEVQKLRKVRKSLNSKQRQCRKSGNELPENDAAELQRISSEQAIFQKHLDTSRKQSRQHGMLIQEYRNKQQQQQQKQAQQSSTSGAEACSPLMSPSQHSSPMHSPAALMSQSPGPGSVPSNMLQHSPAASMVQHSPNPPLLQHSPGNPQSNPGTMSPHSNMQQSPRIGTPQSQPEESPFSPGTMPSPGICGPTVQRMTSPQHRVVPPGARLTTSPGSFTADGQQIRMAQQVLGLPQRFVRPGVMGDGQRPRMPVQGGMMFGQRSPLGSPQSNQQPMLTQQQHQQMLQRQQMIQQQHEVSSISQENQNIINQRNLQMVQRQQSLQQQQQQQQQVQQQQQQIMQKPPTSPMMAQPASSPSPQLHQQMQQQNYNQPSSSPHPRSPMVQQTMGSPMLQQQLSQSSQPSSPMNSRASNHPPNSPMVSQYQPPSPMSRNHPSTSPMLHQVTGAVHHPPPCQTPNSPMPRSPMVGGSPMQMQRRTSTGNSPAMPDRPQSVENPATPRTPHTPHTPHSAYSSQNSSNHSIGDQQQQQQQQQQQHLQQQNFQQMQQESNMTLDQNNRGGGNPHNPNNPIPLPVLFGRYGYFKLGLRGGSPMWSSKPESSKGKTAESSSSEEKPNTSTVVHRKTGISQSKINSLVCADYNDFDDDSHTPPQTPPTTVEPKAATSSITNNSQVTLGSPSEKGESLPDTTDYDDDKTIINTEVTLSSTAQKDNDDMSVMEQFDDPVLDVITGSLESDIQEEYVLFESDMVLSVDSNDSLRNALVNDNNDGHDFSKILEIAHSEPPSEDAIFEEELLSQSSRNKKSLHLDIGRGMPGGKRVIVTDTPDSPDQEDLSVDPSTSLFLEQSPDQDLMVSLAESDIVILDPTKSPDNVPIKLCDEETSDATLLETEKVKEEKVIVTAVDSVVVTKPSATVNEEIKMNEGESKEKKIYSFSFQDKLGQISQTNLQPTIVGVSGVSKPLVTYSAKSNAASEAAAAAAKSQIKPAVAISSTNIIKELLITTITTTEESPKSTITPATTSSTVAEVKNTSKLSQNIQKTFSTSTIQIAKVVSKPEEPTTKQTSASIPAAVGKPSSSSSENMTAPQPSISVAEKLTVSSKLPSQILQSKTTVSKSNEKIKGNPSQVKLNVQHSPVSNVSAKTVTTELPKQDIPAVKSTDTCDSGAIVNETKKKVESVLEVKKEEVTKKANVESCSSAVTSQDSSVVDEKKTDILNTTDELESMLEAMHNPDDENKINGEKNKSRDKSEVTTLKRMSPVTDDLSLVNILENDVETVAQSEVKEDTNGNSQNRKIVKVEKIEKAQNVAESRSSEIASEKDESQSSAKTEDESSKFFLQSQVSEEKPVLEESSDDILDMLHNIISSKPEMQDKSQKSSLMYQLEAPLESLPLNILQDPLVDLDQEPATSETSNLEVEKKSALAKTSSSAVQPATAATKKTLVVQTTTTTTTQAMVVSTVAHLQSTTTTVPHLSPLSQPTEIKTNTENVSDQLRTLLSSLHSNPSQSYTSSVQSSIVTSGTTTCLTSSTIQRLQANAASSTAIPTSKTDVSSASSKEASSTSATTTATATTTSNLSKALSGLGASRPTISSTVSVTSNAMLNAMLSSTSSIKPSVAGGPRASTVLTSSSNLLNSVMSQSSTQQQRPVSRVLVNATPAAQQPATQTPGGRSIAAPLPIASVTNAVTVTTSILQSTLSQAPTLLHTQLTAGTSQYKPASANATGAAASLLIDNKGTDPDSSAVSKGALKKDVEGLLLKGLSTEKPSTSRSESDISKPSGPPHRMEDSQNVLLKQLLQNTACATTSGSSSTTQTPSFPNVPSLEAQLARPVPPTPSSLIPPLLDEIPVTKPTTTKQVLSRETSFLSHVVKSQTPSTKEESSKSTPAVSSPLLTTLTKPPIETQQTKVIPTTPQAVQPPAMAAVQKQLAPTPLSVISVEKPVVQEPTTSQSQVKTAVDSTTSNVAQLHPQQTSHQVAVPVSAPRTPMQVDQPPQQSSIPQPVQQPQQQQQQQQQTVQLQQPQLQQKQQQQHLPPPPPQQQQQQQQQQSQPQMQAQLPQQPPLTPKVTTPTESREVTPSQSPQQGTVAAGQIQHPKSVSPAIQRSPSVGPPVVTPTSSEVVKSPQNVNTIQPSVPQTIAQTLGRQAQPPQGTIVQHTVPLTEVKKEILDDVLSSGASVQLTDTKDFISTKEELIDGSIDDKTDLKKIKRRQYQHKRRQSQGKDASMAPQKKRSRKVSRLDEDYDTYVDNLMVQLRQLPPMAVLEPLLGKNFGVCPIFGSGDLTKFGGPVEYNTRTGELIGTYGKARVEGISDHYNTQPFGELEPLPPLPPVSTQRSFYDQEFPPLKLDDTDDKKENSIMGRDIDTPDTIVSSSSPECVIPEYMHRFPGLKLIDEESDEESDWLKRISPVIPIISPIPIRLKPGHLKDVAKQDKENVGITRFSKSSPATLTENGNVTVTLTLNSQAADDIMGVLKDLANILNIAPPTGYQIIERTTTPPSQKLGLYRFKGKDGKEGAPIDIQSILNGAAKFCRHCDVVILNNLIRKKVSDLPFLSKEEAEPGDELCFCSVNCYMQFAVIHRTTSNTHDKAAAIVDHLCQKSSESKILEDDLKKIQEKKFSLKQTIGQIDSMDVDSIEMDIDRIKSEKDDESQHSRDSFSDEKRPKKHPVSDEPSNDSLEAQPPPKVWKGLRYKSWALGSIQPTAKYKKPSDREITEMLFRMGVTVTFPSNTDDTRRCMFCQNVGDGAADGTARLLNFDVDKWVHLNCALWSEDVYETVNGALMNLNLALNSAKNTTCILCKQPGATVKCFKIRCSSHYHLGCAVRDGCIFYKNKSTYCSQHVPKNEKDNELTTLSVYRRVYVNRDENKQVAAVMHHQSDHNNLLRVGSLIFLSVGQLLPHQLANFHTANHIYPVGYKIVRFYWSMRRPNKRCRYVCSIHDVSGRPEFRVLVQEPSQEDVELRDASPRAVWNRILEPLAELRRSTNSVQLFPRYVTGEDLFGLTEPAVVRVLESLPGIETLTDYRFKYGRNPLLELPLAINPSGCARTEARLKNQLPWKRPHTQRTASSARATYAPASNNSGELACPYSKQFVHSKSSQYKKMKQDWRNNVYLARSKIQGLGLYAARDLEKHTMVIEYIGEIIRTELAETREKQYEARNRGIYMFRLDEDRVVDATLCGGLARYINHSCNPNCVAEIVEVERDLRIIIFAKRRISRGEELAYDYKFDIEDDQHKIACACGAPNCRKWMN